MTGHLLVIGAQRCGTSYLHRVLDEHPQVEMARPARPEPKFFSDPERYARGLTWYVRTFFGPGDGVRLRGDKSTSYLESPAAAQRAAAVLGDAHVVAMLRDPLARAVSNWRFSTANKLEDRPLEQALADNLEAPRAWDAAATSVSPYAYLERGHYIDYLRPWARFGERLHVLFL
nr:sulfotransferase [Euzebyales bacterium]